MDDYFNEAQFEDRHPSITNLARVADVISETVETLPETLTVDELAALLAKYQLIFERMETLTAELLEKFELYPFIPGLADSSNAVNNVRWALNMLRGVVRTAELDARRTD